MTIKPLIESVEVITDEQGRKKAVLDWQVWEEIVGLLEGHFQPEIELELAAWDALSDEALAEMEQRLQAVPAIMGKYRSVPTSSEEFARRKQEEIELEDGL